MNYDYEIEKKKTKQKITDIAKKINLENHIQLFGDYKAKVEKEFSEPNNESKLILVTSMSPTPAGEGKTTVAIGLNDALNAAGKKSIAPIREPSMAPVFGVKGGATGGGYSQVTPASDINLHFTGDMHAITSANNLICSMIDNHIYYGNELDIDINNIYLKRCIDNNDRTLREIEIGLGKKTNGIQRKDGFIITAATEIMAILCLAKNKNDLLNRLDKIIIGLNTSKEFVYLSEFNMRNDLWSLLKEAFKPNLVQSLENNPVLIHGGPFANIAHGCSSIVSTYVGMNTADYLVTEAGFGSDLGSEKFVDIKCAQGNIKPNFMVLVVSIKSLKYHGGVNKEKLNIENISALKKGCQNLLRHLSNIKNYNVNYSIVLNEFKSDTQNEKKFLENFLEEIDEKLIVTNFWGYGSNGGNNLVSEIDKKINNDLHLNKVYDVNESFEIKLSKILKTYGCFDYTLSSKAKRNLDFIKKNKLDDLYICIAKTPLSFTGNKNIVGAPNDFEVVIDEITVSNGAGFLVVSIGDILLMPGLPKKKIKKKICVIEYRCD